ncbi:LVIVD repeat-containing protein [Spirilliplanes yamanashiensis]|uniref:LVIVD repeat-containing protein n=1 Tax=Spirilliplanes yamanashiensis TaxID=42233 RepID=UPI0019511EB4|nr:hypothetical protein [Spirilliplanes yamanashiensis]MDP9818451.1 hypothetical protein [Spirilliplanes yamanashiensis]
MLKPIRVGVVVAAVLALLAPATPSSAGHESDPRTRNLQPLGHTDEDRRVTDFFQPFFTDAAFWGKVAYQGVWWGGFRTIDVSDPRRPRVLSEVDCGVFQGDIGVWGDLVFRSVDSPVTATNAQQTCANDSPAVLAPAGGFEGIQIFRVKDPRRASARDLVTVVGTDCGSHTHTVVPDLRNGRILLYVSSSGAAPEYAATRFGNSCSAEHGKFQVVEVPIRAPQRARVIADVPLGRSADATVANDCHDIGVLMNQGRRLAVCAGDVAVLFDITNPAAPRFLRSFSAPGVSSWHSGQFSYDGRVAVMGWEPGGGVAPECEAADPAVNKSIFFFDTRTGRLLGTWQLPRPQSATENCTIHNYGIVPTARRDVLVTGAYQAGTWVVDFTDPRRPRTLAWTDPPSYDPANLTLAGAWGSYWYNGHIYETNITEGLNIYRLRHPAVRGARWQPFLNPQTQLGPVR